MLPYHLEIICATNFGLSAVERLLEFSMALVKKVLNADAKIKMRRVSVAKPGVETNVGRKGFVGC